MIDMVKRHEIQVLRRAGHSLREVAALAGVSKRTVERVDDEDAVTAFDTATERERRRVGRPSKAEPFRTLLVGELTREPELLAVELLRRAHLAGYAGGKSALYALVKELRPERPRPLVRFEGLPGEFTQHDFGQVEVRFLDEKKRRVHFFASRLKYSRFVQVSLVIDEHVESLVRAMVDHFAAMGGVPLLAVFDRPKTVAHAWDREGRVPAWNQTFAGVALDLGLGVELCWPHSPEQKGSVENLVGWVKGSFFKAAPLPRRRGPRPSARRVAHRGEHAPPLAGHGRGARRAPRRRAAAPAAPQGGSGRARAPRPGLRRTHGRGQPRGPRRLHASRCHRDPRNPLPLPRDGAHRGWPLRGRP
jgi:transposase